MQRWLASQSKGRPKQVIFFGLGIIAAGVVVLVSTSAGVRYAGVGFILVGAFNVAVGTAAWRERRSAFVD